ncbi:hypothetical protein KCP75_10215 [Salmonella enterica subsp. enterica]|nr:hypothetical protein KCP75_10215 [Salmonella enterica subsp. enterica]
MPPSLPPDAAVACCEGLPRFKDEQQSRIPAPRLTFPKQYQSKLKFPVFFHRQRGALP